MPEETVLGNIPEDLAGKFNEDSTVDTTYGDDKVPVEGDVGAGDGQQPPEDAKPAEDAGKPDSDESDWYSPELAARAELYGWSEEDARRLGSAAALEVTLDHFGSTIMNQTVQPVQQPVLPEQPAPPEQPLQQAPPEPAPAPVQMEGPIQPFETSFSEEDLGNDVVAAEFQKFVDHQNQQVQMLTQQLSAMSSEQADREHEEFASRMDTMCNAAPDHLKPLLGNGRIWDLNQNGPEFSNRNKLGQTFVQMEQQFSQNGRDVDDSVLFAETCRLMFPDLVQKQAELESGQQRANRLRNQSGQFVARATGFGSESGDDSLADNEGVQRIAERTGVPIR